MPGVKYNFSDDCSFDAELKALFHSETKRLLKLVANEMGFTKGSFDIRSNMGGIAVSGEIILHHEHVYIQASNPGHRYETGLMIRTCDGRKDYSGGKNHFASLSWLEPENHEKLVRLICQVMEQKIGFDEDKKRAEGHDEGYNPHYSTPRISR